IDTPPRFSQDQARQVLVRTTPKDWPWTPPHKGKYVDTAISPVFSITALKPTGCEPVMTEPWNGPLKLGVPGTGSVPPDALKDSIHCMMAVSISSAVSPVPLKLLLLPSGRS